MRTATLTALRAVLESDPAKTHADRETHMQVLGIGKTMDVPPAAANRLVSFEEAARRLNRSTRAVHLLARRGVLHKAVLPGFQRASGVLERDLNNLLSGMGASAGMEGAANG